MKRFFIIGGLIGLVVLLSAVFTASEAQEETKYAWGTVSSVSASGFVLTEYDYDNEQKVDITYSCDAQTKLYNLNSLQELKAGDNVWIDYMTKDKQRIALGIEIEDFSEETDTDTGTDTTTPPTDKGAVEDETGNTE
ncbi:MAG: hypothetical protein V1662_02385 [Candidatus Omnitrophota bacterium]